MTLSHRARLTAVASISVGILLAVVFRVVWWFSGTLERRATGALLEPSVAQVVDDLIDGNPKPDLGEQTDSNRSLALAEFDLNGNLLQWKGPVRLPATIGHSEFEASTADFLTYGVKSHGRIIVLGLRWTERKAALNRLGVILCLLWAPLVGVVAAVTWFAARATFRPLESLTRQAAGLGATQLSGRLEVPEDAEFGAFARHLNRFLDRLEKTVKREEQFASDAAHELRTPLTILLGHIETALLKRRDVAEYETSLQVALAEVERLSRLVQALLQSARAGSAPAVAIDVERSVEQVHARWVDRFEANKIHLILEGEEALVEILDEEIGCVLDNLLENALRHGPEGSTCTVRLVADGGSATITVADEGPGIAADLLPDVFDRFVRSEGSRSRQLGGFGIGLATCKRIVASRGGTIAAENVPPHGAKFAVTLPISARSDIEPARG